MTILEYLVAITSIIYLLAFLDTIFFQLLLDNVKILATTSAATLGYLDVSSRKYNTVMRAHTDKLVCLKYFVIILLVEKLFSLHLNCFYPSARGVL